MHELHVTERILKVVLDHAQRHAVSRIAAIHLDVGELSDLEDEWLRNYFDDLSRGTAAESARLVIERIPIVLKCEGCGHSFKAVKGGLQGAECPECEGTRCRLVSGQGYVVKSMDVA